MRKGFFYRFSRNISFLLLVFCLLSCIATPSFASREFIDQFFSLITIETDGSLIVEERIDIQAGGNEFRRGFIRDIPEYRVNREGRRYKTPIELLSVTREGQEEPYKVSHSSGNISIRIGSPDIMLRSGLHSYVLRYRAHRQVTFFDKHDELYWNVTGNDWSVPIEKSGAFVILPEGGKALQTGGWLGYSGSQRQDLIWKKASEEREVSFHSGESLEPGMGLTIAVAFPKGVVMPPEPTWAEKVGAAPVVGALSLLVLLIGGAFWYRWGREAPAGIVIPLYHGPEGFSPASARLIHSGVIDNISFASNVISLAVKDYLTIDSSQDGEKYRLTGTGTEKGKPLTSDEQALFEGLKLHKSPVVFNKAQARQIASASDSMTANIEMICDGLVRKNMGPRFLYMAIVALLLGLTVFWTTGELDKAIVAPIFSWICTGVFLFLASQLSSVIRWFREKPTGKIVRVFPRILSKGLLLFFALPWTATTVSLIFQLKHLISSDHNLTQIWFALGAALGLVMAFWIWFIDAPTEKGVTLSAQIEGLRLYIAMAEADRMNLVNPPGRTPAHFEELLPYALALNLEEAWAASFADVLAQSSESEEIWHPRWSSSFTAGQAFSLQSFHHMSNDIGNSYQSALRTISASSGSRSSSSAFSGDGSSGGGSSGGGGGGGGGRGW